MSATACAMRLFVGVSLLVAAVSCSSSSSTVTGPSPAKCDLQLSLATGMLPASGGSGQLTITTTPECSWTATSQASWLSGFTPSSGQGSGQVEFRASANSVPSAREGEIVVNNARATVRQQAATCSVEVSPTSQDVGASGGSTSVTVTTLTDCTWSATSDASWVAVAPSSGSGSGTVTITVAANDAGSRTAIVNVAGRAVTIRQDGVVSSTCNAAITPASQAFGVAGGAGGPVQVSVAADCTWTASTNASWIAITSGASGTGAGTVTFTVAANSGSARSGTLTIGGQAFTVTQEGVANCVFTVTPTSQRVDAAGGTPPAIAVVTTSECSWSASSSADWLTIVGGSSATGNGLVTYQVAANTGAERTATLTVAGHAVTVTQSAAPCSYGVTPTAVTVGPAGGAGTPITLSTAATCEWSATSNASWITITSAASGTGSATVQYSVAANTGAERTGTITVAGQAVTVTQSAASCSYAVTPTTVTIGAAGGAGTPITLTTAATCQWSATSNASWITITSAPNGTGSAAVQYTVAANTGGERRGTITIADQTVEITQAAGAPACSYTVDRTTLSVGAAGGANSISVTTTGGCAWTAASTVSWITITSGASGSGNGTVAFSVAANTGGPRTGVLTIAGHSVTVTQAAAEPPNCASTIAPTSQSAPATGAIGSVSVTVASGCAWTAVSTAPWVTVTGGQSGQGTGTVSYAVAPNPGPARTGTITIAGQTFTINQAAVACTYAITPTSYRADGNGGPGVPIVVTAPIGCAWTASASNGWITITSGQSGTGPGTVTFSLESFNGNQRTGTIIVAGITFTITQGRE